MKRNEQGAWQKRFLCVVPHMFLYYFDNENAEAPRGVIDLELFHHVGREENILKLSTSDEDRFRCFYFDDDDKENLNEWMISLLRDRYHAVCDERNAYQQMQLEMTGAIDIQSSLHKSSEREKQQLESDLERWKQQCEMANTALQLALVDLGVSYPECKKKC